IHPTPLVTAGSIGPYAHLFRCRLALNDEHSPTMHEQMVDLTDACGAILFRLLWIFDPKPVKNAHIWVVIESAMQVVRQLPLRDGACLEAGSCRHTA
ncbi:MAG: hypothetical protein OXG51_01545, partial [Gammaproteobacteria bacterium]|nr:hypothetical protein [Gammaproteobacteria bacterium]